MTTLSLIWTSPLVDFRYLRMTRFQKYAMFPSRATLVVCSNNLVQQWCDEIIKCIPQTSFNFLKVDCMEDHKAVSWKQCIEADIIVLGYILANAGLDSCRLLSIRGY